MGLTTLTSKTLKSYEMKKLLKINLLGEANVLSKDELKQLVGAQNPPTYSDGCYIVDKPGGVKKCTGPNPCVTDPEGQLGHCGWNIGTINCECLVYG